MIPENYQNAVNHTDGKVPIDFGSGPTTGIHVSLVEELRRHFGLDLKPIKIVEPGQMLGEIDDDLKNIIGIETEMVAPKNGFFGFPDEDWKEWLTPWGQVVLVPECFRTRIESNDDVVIFPEGDLMAEPSGRMPSDSFFFDTIIRQNHFNEDALDPQDNLEEFGLYGQEELDHFQSEAQRVRGLDRFVLANIGGTALGDIALVPAPFLKDPRGIRDITEWYISTALRQDYIHEVFERQIDTAIENLKQVYAVTNDAFDAVYICGTDFGTQHSTFCSIEIYESLWKPHYQKLNNWIHHNTHWLTFKHSCGAIAPLVPHLIDSGFDLLNPVQLSATGMDGKDLKSRHGDSIVFWGGGVDTQNTLPFGDTSDIRKEVLNRCEILGANGGFVFNSIHNIQAKTPVENVVAMISAVKEFNGDSWDF